MIHKRNFEKFLPYVSWLFFALFTLHYAVEISNGGRGWKTADWLINYAGGPIRRGLSGTVLLAVSDFGFPLLWATFLFQVSIYALVFIFVLKLYYRIQRSLFWLLILYSPAFLLFPFYDLQGSFRKEIMVLAIFSYLCIIYADKTINHPRIIFIILLFVLAGLSHEITVLTLPFFIFLFYRSSNEGLVSKRAVISYGLLMIGSSLAVLTFATLYKGDSVSAKLICQTLLDRDLAPQICKGAIEALHKDTSGAISSVISMFGSDANSIVLLFALSISPLFFTSFWSKETTILFIAVIIFFAPLFLVAIDWGRWIYIIIFMLFCVALSDKITINLPYRLLFVVIGFIYLTTWHIPHCCVGGEIGDGFIGKVLQFLKKISEAIW